MSKPQILVNGTILTDDQVQELVRCLDITKGHDKHIAERFQESAVFARNRMVVQDQLLDLIKKVQ